MRGVEVGILGCGVKIESEPGDLARFQCLATVLVIERFSGVLEEDGSVGSADFAVKVEEMAVWPSFFSPDDDLVSPSCWMAGAWLFSELCDLDVRKSRRYRAAGE